MISIGLCLGISTNPLQPGSRRLTETPQVDIRHWTVEESVSFSLHERRLPIYHPPHRGTQPRLPLQLPTPRPAYTFDAGPNAVIYAEEKHIPTIVNPVILRYFPLEPGTFEDKLGVLGGKDASQVGGGVPDGFDQGVVPGGFGLGTLKGLMGRGCLGRRRRCWGRMGCQRATWWGEVVKWNSKGI
ncbi:hypothetical protein C8R42DRAFT_736701 [Lentinula raphanica]|nr:hypothetical protein C8R42DRAFT_736701 [Lentinula raphanica]